MRFVLVIIYICRFRGSTKRLSFQGKRIINRFAPKIAPSRENGLSKPQASLLHAFCTCNYIHLPLARQHKTSVFVSRFAPSRYFYYKNKYNAFALGEWLTMIEGEDNMIKTPKKIIVFDTHMSD